MIKISPFIIIIIILSFSNARAQNLTFEVALDKHIEGLYYQSLKITDTLKSADSHALAARSRLILTRFYLAEEERLENIEIALKDALKALELDETHLEGNLQAGFAWGLKAQIQGKISEAKQAKIYIDKAIKFHPNNPWGWAALGGWGLEIVHSAGGVFSRVLFGVKLKSSLEAFDKSLKLAENKISFLFSYSRALLRLNKNKYRNKALKLLKEINPLKPQNFLDQISKKFATGIIRAIEKNDGIKLEILLDNFSRIPDSEKEGH